MKRGKVIFLQLISIFICNIASFTIATQQVADGFNRPESFNKDLLVGTYYRPWAIIKWFLELYEPAPKPFDDVALLLIGGFMVGVIIASKLKKLRPQAGFTEHGSAHFGTSSDFESMGVKEHAAPKVKPWMAWPIAERFTDTISLSDVSGVVVGANNGKILSHSGAEHLLVFAPTRSGKGVGIVVPTLLSWRDSVVVLDVKGENWNLTSGWRSKFSHTLCFNPTDLNSVHYNPLDEVRNGPESIRDVANLVETLCAGDGAKSGDPFWTNSAKSLLKGVILFILNHRETKTLSEVLRTLRDPDIDRDELWELMIQSDVNLVKEVGASMRAEQEKTTASIISSAISFLNIFDDPTLAEVTSKSDFRLRDLQFADNPVSLYLVIPPSDINRLKPLLRLMLSQIGTALTEVLQLEGAPNRLLMLLDEFPILGKVEWLESALAFVAGYDIKMMLIAQDLNQIESAYGANNSILGNCHVRIAFASNDEKTAKRISDLLGQTTGSKTTESLSGKRASIFPENSSKSTVLFGRPLMTAGEIMQMGENALLFVAGSPPLSCDKVKYYEELTYVSRCPGLTLDGAGLYSEEMTSPELSVLDVPSKYQPQWGTLHLELIEDEEVECPEADNEANGSQDRCSLSQSVALSRGSASSLINPDNEIEIVE